MQPMVVAVDQHTSYWCKYANILLSIHIWKNVCTLYKYDVTIDLYDVVLSR